MAGSRKWFVYDSSILGVSYAINLDESNTEDVNAANNDYAPSTDIRAAIPKNLSPRAAVYGNATGTRTIRCVCLTEAIFNGLLSEQPAIDDPLQTGQTLNLLRLEAESIRLLPTAVDTGLNDGDAT